MRVAVLCNGSRGDLEPYLALAHGLEARDHKVYVLTNADHIDACTSHGIEAVTAYPPLSKYIRLAGMDEDSDKDEFHRQIRKWKIANARLLQAGFEAIAKFQPDILLCSPFARTNAMDIGEAQLVPVIEAFMQPESFKPGMAVQSSSSWPPPPAILAVSPLVVPKLHMPERDVRCTGYWHYRGGPAAASGVPLQAEPPDGGGKEICAETAFAGQEELQTFLAAGRPPVCFGWGSMRPKTLTATGMAVLALRTLRSVGMRGVILGGWARVDCALEELQSRNRLSCGTASAAVGAKPAESFVVLPSQVCREGETVFIDELLDDTELEALLAYAEAHVHVAIEVPHAWLFPRCLCAVHHGGAGTTGASLRAGVPTIITPVLFDQFTWGRCVEDLGVGRGLPPLAKLDFERLAGALREVVDSEEIHRRAEELGRQMRSEDGVAVTVDLLEEFSETIDLDNLRHKRNEVRHTFSGCRESDFLFPQEIKEMLSYCHRCLERCLLRCLRKDPKPSLFAAVPTFVDAEKPRPREAWAEPMKH